MQWAAICFGAICFGASCCWLCCPLFEIPLITCFYLGGGWSVFQTCLPAPRLSWGTASAESLWKNWQSLSVHLCIHTYVFWGAALRLIGNLLESSRILTSQPSGHVRVMLLMCRGMGCADLTSSFWPPVGKKPSRQAKRAPTEGRRSGGVNAQMTTLRSSVTGFFPPFPAQTCKLTPHVCLNTCTYTWAMITYPATKLTTIVTDSSPFPVMFHSYLM